MAYYRRLGEGNGTGDGAAPATSGESSNGREAEDKAPFAGPAQPQFAPPAEETAPAEGGTA